MDAHAVQMTFFLLLERAAESEAVAATLVTEWNVRQLMKLIPATLSL